MITQPPANAIPMPIIQFPFTDFSSGWQLIGSFTEPVELMVITSTLDGLCGISFDGINYHLILGTMFTNYVIDILEFKANFTTLPTPSVYINAAGGSFSTGAVYVSAFSRQQVGA